MNPIVDGPRPLRSEERPSLSKLLNAAFRSKYPGDMFEDYPQLYNEDNQDHLIVIVEKGEVVSHAGMTVRQISFEGVLLTVGLVGGVATAEHHRGRGYATKCLDFLLDKAARQAVDLAWISGGRGLYTVRGAAKVGRERVFHVPAGKNPKDLTLRQLTASDLGAAARLYCREPVRFFRSRDDWINAWKSRCVMDRRGWFWGVFREESLAAYIIVHEPWEDTELSLVAEFAGDRFDAAAALPTVAQRMGLSAALAHLSASDLSGFRAFARIARDRRLDSATGTFLPIRIAQCMDRLRPRIAEHCGLEISRNARFHESGEGPGTIAGRDAQLHIAIGDEHALIAGRAGFARFLLGTPVSSSPNFEGASSVIEALQPAFPIPTPWYGINYV